MTKQCVKCGKSVDNLVKLEIHKENQDITLFLCWSCYREELKE